MSIQKLLQKQQLIEREFHDQLAKSISPRSVFCNKAFDAITALENHYALSLMGPIKDKKILDLGCGMGDTACYFASRKARVCGIDISGGMILLVKKLAKMHHLDSHLTSRQMAAEALKFPSNSFDFVFGNGILHHVYPDLVLEEVYRVLKPGGRAFFVEPLAHNPLINIYRRLASRVRTSTEHPLDYSRLSFLTKAPFESFCHKEFHFLTLLIFVWYFLVERADPGVQRYWKKIINESERIEIPFRLFNACDNFILAVFPFLRRFCWNTVLVFGK